jgi:hypothetical protein
MDEFSYVTVSVYRLKKNGMKEIRPLLIPIQKYIGISGYSAELPYETVKKLFKKL